MRGHLCLLLCFFSSWLETSGGITGWSPTTINSLTSNQILFSWMQYINIHYEQGEWEKIDKAWYKFRSDAQKSLKPRSLASLNSFFFFFLIFPEGNSCGKNKKNKKQPAEWYIAEATFVIMWAAHTQHPDTLLKRRVLRRESRCCHRVEGYTLLYLELKSAFLLHPN